MYCPKCSQNQVSDEVRFCSRCGFQLGVVKELLAESNDTSVETIPSETRPKFFSRRKQDLLFGATFLFIAAVLTIQMSWVFPKAALVVPLGMVWLAFSLLVLFFEPLARLTRRFFAEDAEPAKLRRSVESASAGMLSPTQRIPVGPVGSQSANTGEMLWPPSVTEHTTKLLERK